MVEGLKRVERGVDKTASELAIARLRQDIDELTKRYRFLEGQSHAGTIVYGVTAIAVTGALMYGALSGGASLGSGFWIFFVFLLVGIGMVWSGISDSTSESREKAEINARIGTLRSEIEKHERIVKM